MLFRMNREAFRRVSAAQHQDELFTFKKTERSSSVLVVVEFACRTSTAAAATSATNQPSLCYEHRDLCCGGQESRRPPCPGGCNQRLGEKHPASAGCMLSLFLLLTTPFPKRLLCFFKVFWSWKRCGENGHSQRLRSQQREGASIRPRA